jgi:uncharacterized membrane protein
MADGKVSVADGPEQELDQGSDATGASAGSRHDAGSAETPAYGSQSESNLGDRHGEESNQGGSGGPSSEVVAASHAVAEVEEILEGEIDDRRVEQIISHESWAGPLPPPAALAAYERVLPGAADRAFTLAEQSLEIRQVREQTVRISIEGEVAVQTALAEADRDALKRGQFLAAGIASLIGVLSFAGLWLTPWAAVGFTVPLAQVAAALIRTVSDRYDSGAVDMPDEPEES